MQETTTPSPKRFTTEGAILLSYGRQKVRDALLAEGRHQTARLVLQLHGRRNAPAHDTPDSDGDSVASGWGWALQEPRPESVAVTVQIADGTPRSAAVRLVRKLAEWLATEQNITATPEPDAPIRCEESVSIGPAFFPSDVPF